MTSRYSMLIRWSDEDQAFIVMLPEFDNAKTHGTTYEQAARMGRELIESCIMWWQQDGKPLPKPNLFVYPGTDFSYCGAEQPLNEADLTLKDGYETDPEFWKMIRERRAEKGGIPFEQVVAEMEQREKAQRTASPRSSPAKKKRTKGDRSAA